MIDGTERERLLRVLDIVTELLDSMYNDNASPIAPRGAVARVRVARSILKSLRQKRGANHD